MTDTPIINHDQALDDLRGQVAGMNSKAENMRHGAQLIGTVSMPIGIGSGANGFVRKDAHGNMIGVDPIGAAGMALTLVLGLTTLHMNRVGSKIQQASNLLNIEIGKAMGDRNTDKQAENFKVALAQNNTDLARAIGGVLKEHFMPDDTMPGDLNTKPKSNKRKKE